MTRWDSDNLNAAHTARELEQEWGGGGVSDLVKRFEFVKPYEAAFSDGLQCRWLRLNYNGMLVASFSVDAWGSEQACIEAAWNYAYGVKDDSGDLNSRIEQLERELAAYMLATQHANDHADAAIADIAAEKALADQGREVVQHWVDHNHHPCQLSDEFLAANRKARGL